MAGSSLLLDTSVVIEILRGSKSIRNLVESAERVTIPSIVLGELYYGAFNSSDPKKHLGQISALLTIFEFAMVDGSVAENYGKIKSALRKAGNPIPENDVWIATRFSERVQHTLSFSAFFSFQNHTL